MLRYGMVPVFGRPVRILGDKKRRRPYTFYNQKEVKTMQKTKIFTITILAALLVCSAFSFAAAQQDTPTVASRDVDSTNSPSSDKSEVPPVEGEGTAPDAGDAREPITGDNLNGVEGDVITPGAVDENATLYAAYGQEAQDKTTATDNTDLYITIGGAAAAVAVGGAAGFVYYRKTKN